jgi:hypothetical protein
VDEVVEENGRTYHVFKDGSEFLPKKIFVVGVELMKGIEYMLPNDEVWFLSWDRSGKFADLKIRLS